MPFPLPDSTVALPVAQTSRSKASPLEEEVISLFDNLQERLLLYFLSLGLQAQDGEEIVQEVFLALFQHLQRGKSRSNLRAWVFQVSHNIAVKRLIARRRDSQHL